MNLDLQEFFSRLYNADIIPPEHQRGSSSVQGTIITRQSLGSLFKQYNIKSMFDAGCQDCCWSYLITDQVSYQGGDISESLVRQAKMRHPDLEICVHDVTNDPLPAVDMLLLRDVAIHLSDADKRRAIKNWVASQIPWLLMTHTAHIKHNAPINYEDGFPWAAVNWTIDPWNFPAPIVGVDDCMLGDQRLGLWHRDDIKDLPCLL